MNMSQDYQATLWRSLESLGAAFYSCHAAKVIIIIIIIDKLWHCVRIFTSLSFDDFFTFFFISLPLTALLSAPPLFLAFIYCILTWHNIIEYHVQFWHCHRCRVTYVPVIVVLGCWIPWNETTSFSFSSPWLSVTSNDGPGCAQSAVCMVHQIMWGTVSMLSWRPSTAAHVVR